MIILEGPNKAGKTTLAGKLAKGLDWDIHKFATIPQVRRDYDWQVKKSLELLSTQTIQDRTPIISDLVYAEFNTNRTSFSTLTRLHYLFANHKAVIVYCNFDADKSQIADKYRRLFNFADEDEYLAYNYETDEYSHLLQSIRDRIKWT
jgi:adenylate kinase family enzyme